MQQPHDITEPPRETNAIVWAVREPETPDQGRRVEAFLACGQISEIVWFAEHHDDRLDEQAREGRFERVIFADLDALLAPMWKGHLHLDAWLEEGVRFELVDSPLPPEQLRPILCEIVRSHVRFRKQHRRRQTLAAVVLSLLALAAMTAMIWIIPPMK